jgi:hypothetical protein
MVTVLRGMSVVPGAGFTTGPTTTLVTNSNDTAGVVTFNPGTVIPASPYLIFTLTFGGSWTSSWSIVQPVVLLGACANFGLSRTAAAMLASSALGPFYAIPNSVCTTVACYCTVAPTISTNYDIGYLSIPGP